MRTVETKIYKFDELPEETQEKTINNLRDINVDYEWWDYDGLLDLTQEEMDEVGIKADEIKDVLISYKIVEFDFDRKQYIQFESVVVNNDEVFRKFLRIPKELWDQCSYYFENNSRDHNTCLELQTDEPPTDKESEILERAIEIMADKIHESWVSLRASFEFLITDEAVKDTIKANEYEFYGDGTLY